MMHAYQMQRMRAADSHSSTRTPGPVVLPGMRTGAHAGRVPSRRAIAAARLAAAGTIGACTAAVAMAGWAIPAAWATRGYPAAGGEWAAIILAAVAGWYAGIGCAALVLWARYRHQKSQIKR